MPASTRAHRSVAPDWRAGRRRRGALPGLAAAVAAAVVLAPSAARGQTQFWFEDFENGCNRGCLASGYNGPNGQWSIDLIGSNPAGGNTWYVSCTESINGTCGQACTTDESLHVANPSTSPCAGFWCPTGDCGAAYDACGPVSNRRARSPLINCTGKAGISVTFKYIGLADPCLDGTDFQFSADGGTNWTTIQACMTAPVCGNGQGQVTTYTANLPATASNNPNVRIGFRWQNDDDFFGQDPSFAVDKISLRYSCAFPVPPIPMDLDDDLRNTKVGAASVHLDWSLMGPPGAQTTHYHVYRATAPSTPWPWTQIAGDSPKLTVQNYNDPVLADGITYYYDVRSADDCESVCPKPMSIAASSSSPSCDGSGSVTFTSIVSGGQPPFSYDWNFGDGSPHSFTQNTSHTYSYPPYAYTVWLTVTDSSLPFPQSKSTSLTARVGPSGLTATPSQDSPKPVGVPVNFVANPAGGVAPYGFLWDFGDGTQSNAQNPAHAYSAGGTYSVTLTVTDVRGCSYTAPPLIVSISGG